MLWCRKVFCLPSFLKSKLLAQTTATLSSFGNHTSITAALSLPDNRCEVSFTCLRLVSLPCYTEKRAASVSLRQTILIPLGGCVALGILEKACKLQHNASKFVVDQSLSLRINHYLLWIILSFKLQTLPERSVCPNRAWTLT